MPKDSLLKPVPSEKPKDINAIKRIIRHELRTRRRAMSVEDRNHASGIINQQLLNLAPIQSAKVVLAYSSLTEEVSLKTVIERLLSKGTTVWLPKVTGVSTMEALPIRSLADTKVSSLGINEPTGDKDPFYTVPDVVLVPGVGFDVTGNRIGLGQGFYDRFLRNYQQQGRGPMLIGVTFQCQVVNNLPTESTDIPMDFVITEKQLYRRTT